MAWVEPAGCQAEDLHRGHERTRRSSMVLSMKPRRQRRVDFRVRPGPVGSNVPREHGAGEPPCPANSVRMFTLAVHLPVRPWLPRSQGLPREADAARTEAPRRPAVTSGVGPRRRRFTKSSPRTSRAGLSGEKRLSGAYRPTSRTNSAAISSAGSSASHFAQPVCMTCRTGFVVAFSCKGRGVCPSSSGRHMARDGRPPRRSRHPAGARAAVGDLRAEAIAGLSRRSTPGHRSPHEDLS